MKRWKLWRHGHGRKTGRIVGSWQLVLLTILFAGSSAVALRHNNLVMTQLREEVVAADKRGQGVAESLEKLNAYIFRHMNTRVVRPIELVNTYNRQAQAVIEAAQKGSGRDIYAEGTAACERRGIPLSSIAKCIAEYGAQNAPSMVQQKISLPDKNLFIYSFASPLWTPDLAGLLVLITVVLSIWLLSRAVVFVAVRLIVRYRLKNGF